MGEREVIIDAGVKEITLLAMKEEEEGTIVEEAMGELSNLHN